MATEPKPNAASQDPTSLQNGLGLDNLIKAGQPVTKPTKPSSAPAKAVEKVEAKPDAVASKGETKEAAKVEEPVTIETLEKRLKDTRDYATKEAQRSKELQKKQIDLEKRLADAEARLSGTYVEHPPIPPEQIAAVEGFKARVAVDNQVMIEQYGADTIQKMIWDTDSPYQQLEIMDPAVKARVTNATRPIAEAMKILKEREFYEKYGNDPDKIKEAILAEERAKLIAEIQTELKGKPIESVNSLSGANVASREVQRVQPKVGSVPELSTVFPVFHTPNTA